MFFDELPFRKIPIWENKYRIRALTFFRDLYLDTQAFPPPNLIKVSPVTGKPFTIEERRSEINQRKPAVQQIVAHAGIASRRLWPVLRKDLAPLDIDVLDQIWYLEKLRVSYRAPADVIDEAIGRYRDDRRRSWIRTFWPFYWFGLFADWIAGNLLKVLATFGLLAARDSAHGFGHLLFRVIRALVWFIGLAGSVFGILEFFGLREVCLRLIGGK